MDAALNTTTNAILGFEFQSQIVPFSVYKFVQSLFIFAFLAAESAIEERVQLRGWFIGCFALSMVAFLFTVNFDFKEKPIHKVLSNPEGKHSSEEEKSK